MARTPRSDITDVDSTVDPTVNDDVTQALDIGSRWTNTTTDIVYRCTDNSASAAVWVVDGAPEASQAEAEAGTLAEPRFYTPQRIAQAIAALETGGGGTNTRFLRYTYNSKIGPGGEQYLSIGDNLLCSEVGERLTADSTLIGISFSTDAADATRVYEVEVVSDPAGSPALIGSGLTINNATNDARRDLSTSITAATTLIGARVRRTSGSGQSTFSKITVLVELSIP